MKSGKMQCDICGSDRQLVKAKIEGSIMDVCQNCAAYGEIIRTPRPVFLNKPRPILRQAEPEKIEVVVPDYYDLMKKARERKGLTQEEAAQKLNEKESLYHKIEKGQVKPPIPLAKKLETFFGIRLVEIYEDKMQATIASAPVDKNVLTIGDIMRTSKK